jgi:small subunit ribosomal protein S8
MLTDSISDFLTRIRNAGKSRLSKIDTFSTRMNRSIADILVREGYLKSYKEVQDGNKKYLRLYLRFEGGDLKKPVIQGLKRISKPGLRKYCAADKMPRIMSGFGMAIISTSQGVLTEKEARTKGVGGEVLCSVW